jgi:hypothetical protein
MQPAAQTWDSPYTVNARWAIRLLPSLTDFAFILPAFLLFAFLSGTNRLLMDGGTGWHIRTGEWILQHGSVPKTDLFSFTKPRAPWFAWEWGWDVCFAAVHRIWGLAGVAFINICLLCAISALLFALIRRCCGNDALSFLFTGIAVIGSTIHWLARPHLVSWVFLLLFLHVFVSAERGNLKLLAWLPVLTMFWTNLHGGFFLGPVTTLIMATGAAVNGFAEQSWRGACAKAKPYLLALAGCAVATLVNPYSWRLDQHVFSYLEDTKLLEHMMEYRPVNFHEPGAALFECMLLLGVGSAWWCFERGMFARVLMIVFFAHLALLSKRNVPLFFLAASPWAAGMLRSLLGRVKWVPPFRSFARAVGEISGDLRAFERIRRWHVASAAAVVLLAALFAARGSGFDSRFDSRQFPIAAVPALSSLAKSRVFTYDQWGDYMIYRFYPESRVFMDDRSDFYGSQFLETYVRLINAGYNWESDLKRFAIDTVILRPDAPLATVLKQSPDWKLLFDDGRAIVFAASATGLGRAAGCIPTRLSPVSHDGGNESEDPRAWAGYSYSAFINKERRSL